jgi:hypothetical protein
VRLGVTLPTFSGDATGVLDAARAAEEAGIHGVFSFDHLWPLGHPERPSLSIYPMLGAVASVTSRLRVGSLVARVGLVPDTVLAASLESLSCICGDRLVAGLGTGDQQSEPEHLRNGIAYLGRHSRHLSLSELVTRLSSQGIECWIGGGSIETDDIARRSKAALNVWGVSPRRLLAVRERFGDPVTWAGAVPDQQDDAAQLLSQLAEAGATWAVWGWPSSLKGVVNAARLAGIELD